MDKKKYVNIVKKIEDILAGTQEVKSMNGYFKQMWHNKKDEMLFVSKEEMESRITEAIHEIVRSEVDFSTLENVVYAFLSIAYLSMRKLNQEDISIINIREIADICVYKEEMEYLQIIGEIVFIQFVYAYNTMYDEKIKNSEFNGFEEVINDLIKKALEYYPSGEIVNTLIAIDTLEAYLEEPTEEKFTKLEKKFLSNEYIMRSIMILGDAKPEFEYIPYAIYELGSKKEEIDVVKAEHRLIRGWKNEEEEDFVLSIFKDYLKIPHAINIEKSKGEVVYELIDKMIQVRKNERKLERVNAERKNMMDYYAHSWKHIAYPQIVKEVAEELNKTNISMANKLMKAYNSEKTLQRSIELLQYTNSNDERAVSRAFKEGMALSGKSSKNVKRVQDIFDESIDLVVFKLLMTESDDSRRMELCRKKWNNITSLDILRVEYINKFLKQSHRCSEIVQWVDKKMFSITFEIDNVWGDIRFKEDSFALNQFKAMLVEIITNAFVHGERELKIAFTTQENVLEIIAENVSKEVKKSSRDGILTMSRVLDRINFGTGIRSVEKECREGIFRITLRFNKAIMFRKGR